MSFKVQIKNQFRKKFWDIVLIDSLNEWWEDEHWKIQWKHSQGLEIYIQFLIDPMDPSSIWQIVAQKELNDNESIVASLYMSKRKFNIKLKEFISEIEDYRTGKTINNEN